MHSILVVTVNGNNNIDINAYTVSHLDVLTVKYDANEIKNQYQNQEINTLQTFLSATETMIILGY